MCWPSAPRWVGVPLYLLLGWVAAWFIVPIMDGAGVAALVVYLTFGDPSPAIAVDLVLAAATAGADIIELGVPFSDPSADGPVIQAAMERSLLAGAGLLGALRAIRAVRDRGCEVPIVLFGYYKPIFVLGTNELAKRAAAAGVDAVLTVDVPLEEIAELREPLVAAGLDVIPLLAPTSSVARARQLAPLAAPFVYYISMTGVTGAALDHRAVDGDRIAALREASGAPIMVGFGIKTPADVAVVAQVADGVVVGSALVDRIARAGNDAPKAVAEFVASLAAAVHLS